MNKCYSQRIIITQEEYQRIQSQVNQSLQTNSKSRIKQKPQPEQYLFKPEINKQSINLQRSINDLYRWNQNKYQKINQIKEDEIRQIQNNANRLTHEIPSISVFERLYQLRKSSDTQIQQSKRSTYNNKPNYTQNMTNSMYQQYQRQCQFINTIQSKSKTQATENSQMQTPIQNNLDYELHESKNNMNISFPMHQYIDLTQQIQDSPDVQIQSSIQEKEIEVMVERLNNWQAKKIEREQLIAQEYNNEQTANSDHMQTQQNTYQKVFLNI